MGFPLANNCFQLFYVRATARFSSQVILVEAFVGDYKVNLSPIHRHKYLDSFYI